LFAIQSGLNVSIFPKIVECTQDKEAWESLEIAYKGSFKVRVVKLQPLHRYLESLRMVNDDTIEVFMNRVRDLVNAIHVHGEALDDNWIVEKVLRSLSWKFDPINIAIEESRDLS